MTALSRAFLAAYPPADVLDALEERCASLPTVDGLRWAPRDQWHVTVRFCGRVPDARLLVDAVGDACRDRPPVVGLRLAGAGAFPSPRRASTLWIGVGPDAGVAALDEVAGAVESACRATGLAPDDRPFRPHLSVARCSRTRDLRSLVAAVGDGPVGGEWTASELRLVASDTRPTGAVHAEVARFPLGG